MSKVRIVISLPTELYEKVKQLSKIDTRSTSNFIAFTLDQRLKALTPGERRQMEENNSPRPTTDLLPQPEPLTDPDTGKPVTQPYDGYSSMQIQQNIEANEARTHNGFPPLYSPDGKAKIRNYEG